MKLAPLFHSTGMIDHGHADEDIRSEELRRELIVGLIGHGRSIGTTAAS